MAVSAVIYSSVTLPVGLQYAELTSAVVEFIAIILGSVSGRGSGISSLEIYSLIQIKFIVYFKLLRYCLTLILFLVQWRSSRALTEMHAWKMIPCWIQSTRTPSPACAFTRVWKAVPVRCQPVAMMVSWSYGTFRWALNYCKSRQSLLERHKPGMNMEDPVSMDRLCVWSSKGHNKRWYINYLTTLGGWRQNLTVLHLSIEGGWCLGQHYVTVIINVKDF